MPADGQSVFHRDQITVVSESVKKPRTNPRLPSRAKPGDPCEGLFVLPSCIFPKHQLSWSCRGRAPPAVGSCAADICVARSASRGPSGRCAIVGLRCAVRAASLPSYNMYKGLSPPLSHAIGSVIMLGIAYERDASVRRPDHPVNGREVDDLMAGSRTPAAANCEAGARSAGYRRMSPTCAPRGAFSMRSRAHDSTSLQEGTSRACTQIAQP